MCVSHMSDCYNNQARLQGEDTHYPRVIREITAILESDTNLKMFVPSFGLCVCMIVNVYGVYLINSDHLQYMLRENKFRGH